MTSAAVCILVVEDDLGIRSFLRELLVGEGYRVETAVDGVDALRQLGSTPDLILLDLEMPIMDGYEFLRRLRKRTEHAATPVLIVSAKQVEKLIDGAQGMLRKPFEIKTLLGRVSNMLDMHPRPITE